MRTERRKHRRLEISLPIEYASLINGSRESRRATTINVSTGGVYFETGQPNVEPGNLLSLHLVIPPGEGHFPYQGRVSSLGEVVRVDPVEDSPNRCRIAAEFREQLKLDF